MLPKTLLIGLLATLPLASAQAFDLEQALRESLSRAGGERPDYGVTQRNGPSLSEAIERVRRQTGGRIVSAQTKIKNGREVHHIKVLTKDGKVKTHRVPGRQRGNR